MKILRIKYIINIIRYQKNVLCICVEARDHPRVSVVESMNVVEWKYWDFLGI